MAGPDGELPNLLAANDFELFQVPQQFAVDAAAIAQRWKQLQQLAHPDRFAAQASAAQRLAMQWSVRINEAHQRLKDPLRRAAYLCELAGHPIQAESNTHMASDFLMQQMQWREQLEEAQTPAELDALKLDMRTARQQALATCENAIDLQADWPQAVEWVRRLMFMQRFEQDIDRRLDQMDL